MKIILLPTAEAVVEVNKYVCTQGGNPHHCYDIGKVESAIATAFYPGDYPFALGGLAKVAGALCFYLVQSHAFTDGNKRTGALTAITFLNQHGLDLRSVRRNPSEGRDQRRLLQQSASNQRAGNSSA